MRPFSTAYPSAMGVIFPWPGCSFRAGQNSGKPRTRGSCVNADALLSVTPASMNKPLSMRSWSLIRRMAAGLRPVRQ